VVVVFFHLAYKWSKWCAQTLQKKNKQSEKHHTSSSHADVRRSISNKFCMMIEVVRAIISPQTLLGSINSLAARRYRKFGCKRPYRGKLIIILSFIELNQPNLAYFCRLRTRIKPVNFVRIARGVRRLGAIILVKFQIFTVLGPPAVNPHP